MSVKFNESINGFHFRNSYTASFIVYNCEVSRDCFAKLIPNKVTNLRTDQKLLGQIFPPNRPMIFGLTDRTPTEIRLKITVGPMDKSIEIVTVYSRAFLDRWSVGLLGLCESLLSLDNMKSLKIQMNVEYNSTDGVYPGKTMLLIYRSIKGLVI